MNLIFQNASPKEGLSKRLSLTHYMVLQLILLASMLMPVASVSAAFEAKNKIASIVITGSPEGYYNDALTAEAKGDLPAASVALRRALVLDPTLHVAQQHLDELLPKMGLSLEKNWQTKIAANVSPNQLIHVWFFIGFRSSFIAIWLFFTRYLSSIPSEKKKKCSKWPLCLAISWFLLGHAISFLGIMIDPRMTAHDMVIVLPKQDFKEENSFKEGKETTPKRASGIPVRATPVDNAPILSQLPAGSCIMLLSSHGVWSYVRINPGQKGWVASSALEPLVPSGR